MSQARLSEQGKLELVLDLNGDLLEGPVWDERIRKLHFIDIDKQLIHTYDPHAESEHTRCTANASIWLGSTQNWCQVLHESRNLLNLLYCNRHSQVKLPEPVGNIGLTEDPNILLAALRRSIVLFDLTKQNIIRFIPQQLHMSPSISCNRVLVRTELRIHVTLWLICLATANHCISA